MIDRRTFLKTAAAAAGTIILNPLQARQLRAAGLANYLMVHPFVEENPNAVFIMRTNVDVKTNATAKKQAGLDFGRSVFINTDDATKGIPISHYLNIKANLTSRGRWQWAAGYTDEGTMGVVTDAEFVEGVIEAAKEFGVPPGNVHLREVSSNTEDIEASGYFSMAERTGAEFRLVTQSVNNLPANAVNWVNVPEGVWFKRIPYHWPINSPDSWFLNIAKFKTHAMGMTLCAKNIQGTIAASYQQHCTAYSSSMVMSSSDIQTNAKTNIMNNYNRHVAAGVPRWDRPGQEGGIWMETWGSRCLDNNATLKPNLHIIEGIYGRDGHFVIGPNDGYALDYMTNVIIFGKHPFHVDIIGCWLGGHEPGNYGLFHMAKERGMLSVMNPKEIPVYEWKADGSAQLTPLDNFDRTPLKTLYLRRDYNGQTEDQFHLCNEPFDYGSSGVDLKTKTDRPASFILNQNYPNPFNATTVIEFVLPQSGNARLDIFNAHGERIDVLINRFCESGSHLAVWNTRNLASGTYYYRLQFQGFSEVRKMILVK